MVWETMGHAIHFPLPHTQEEPMTKKTGIIALAVLLVSSLLLFTACKGHDQHREAFIFDYFTEMLDLTPEQEDRLTVIHEELRGQIEAMHEERKEKCAFLKTQLAGETIDKEAIRQMIAEHRARMDSVIDLAVDRLVDFHGELTPEQRQKLVAKLEKFEKYHGGHPLR
jgi:Spy/CpxP family protein refolding chaperone